MCDIGEQHMQACIEQAHVGDVHEQGNSMKHCRIVATEIEQQGVEHLIDRSPLAMTSGSEYLHKRIPVQRAYRQGIHHHPLVIPLHLESVQKVGRKAHTVSRQMTQSDIACWLRGIRFIISCSSIQYLLISFRKNIHFFLTNCHFLYHQIFL